VEAGAGRIRKASREVTARGRIMRRGSEYLRPRIMEDLALPLVKSPAEAPMLCIRAFAVDSDWGGSRPRRVKQPNHHDKAHDPDN
jgi:hypothetical protein